ncbi:hypothetical protein DPMN_147200 [Dreissena polymorpha]|uniref:Uncharacterized protein n=1 Tax=Dreissena polymorpha TaxID=45954 RepID=A0A9D4FD91_DREPO|nr:hypothetical protein DPMN_147200 [Dreissena polymorpha]
MFLIHFYLRVCIERELKLCGPHKFIEGGSMPVNPTVGEVMQKVASGLETISVLVAGLEKLIAYLKVGLIKQKIISYICSIK